MTNHREREPNEETRAAPEPVNERVEEIKKIHAEHGADRDRRGFVNALYPIDGITALLKQLEEASAEIAAMGQILTDKCALIDEWRGIAEQRGTELGEAADALPPISKSSGIEPMPGSGMVTIADAIKWMRTRLDSLERVREAAVQHRTHCPRMRYTQLDRELDRLAREFPEV